MPLSGHHFPCRFKDGSVLRISSRVMGSNRCDREQLGLPTIFFTSEKFPQGLVNNMPCLLPSHPQTLFLQEVNIEKPSCSLNQFLSKKKKKKTQENRIWHSSSINFHQDTKSYFLIEKTTYQVPLQWSYFLDKIFLGAFSVGSLNKRKKALFRKPGTAAVCSMCCNPSTT